MTTTTMTATAPAPADFRSRLVVTEQSEYHRFFDRIPAGRFSVSIQASRSHYCEPRVTTSIDAYSSWEIAIFDEHDDWVRPQTDPRLAAFEWRHDFEPGGSPVAGFVPTATIQQIVDDLASLGGAA